MASKFQKIRLVDIQPAEYNPRTISIDDFELLKENIEHYNLVDPIIINLKNNRIIGGHQRYKVLLEDETSKYKELNLLKLGDIGWVFNEDDIKLRNDDDEKILNLSLNNLSGEWDTGKLLDLFDDLNINQYDISLTGFNNNEIVELELSNLDDYIEDNEIRNVELSENIEEMFDERKGALKYELKFDTEADYDFFMDFLDKLGDENVELNATTSLITYCLDKIKEK